MIETLLERAVEAIVGAVSAGSYPAVVALMALESALMPVPSEVVMPFAGFLVARGEMTFWGAVSAGVIGNLLGSSAAYCAGRRWGRRAVQRLPWVDEGHLQLAEGFFQRRGALALLLGRMAPVIRTVISLPAGAAGVSPATLVLTTLAGSIPWNAALVWAGIILEENWGMVRTLLEPVSIALVVAVIAYVLLKVRSLTSGGQSPSPSRTAAQYTPAARVTATKS